MSTKAKLSVSEKKQLEEVKANRMLVIFGLTGVGLILLTLISRLRLFNTIGLSTTETVVGLILVALGVAGVAGGLIWAGNDAKKGISLSKKVFHGLTLATIGVTVVLSALACMFLYSLGVRLSYILVVLVASLGLIRLMFQDEFFVSATILGFGAYLFYAMYRVQASLAIMMLLPLTWFTMAMGLLAVVLLLLLWKSNGKLFGKTILPRSFQYLPALIAAAGLLLAPIGCLLVTMSYLMYIALGFFAVVIAYGVYYTLRML